MKKRERKQKCGTEGMWCIDEDHIVIGEIVRSQDHRIRVSVERYRNVERNRREWFFDVRSYELDWTDWIPTERGVKIPWNQGRKFARLVRTARKVMEGILNKKTPAE